VVHAVEIIKIVRRLLTARRRLPNVDLLRAIRSLRAHEANATQLANTGLKTYYDTVDFRWPYPAGATRTGTYYLNQMMGVNATDGYIDSFDYTKALECFAGLLTGNGQGVGRNPGYDIVSSGDAAGATLAGISRPYRFVAPLATGSASRATDLGKTVYAVDNQTVTLDPTATSFRNIVGTVTNVCSQLYPDTNNTAITGGFVQIAPPWGMGGTGTDAQRVQAALTTVNNSVVLVNVTNLVVEVEAGRKYMFHAKLFLSNNAYGGIQLAIGGTCTATSMIVEGKVYNGTTIQSSGQATALATAFAGVSNTGDSAEIWGEITVNAGGTFTIQFAQNLAVVGNTQVKAGSYLEVYGLQN
jgi:hypothetical protein